MFASILEELVALFTRERLNELIQQPQQHSKELLPVIGIGMALFFIVMILLALLLIRRRPRPGGSQVRAALIGLAVTSVLLFGSLIGSARYTSSQAFCRGCHRAEQKAVRSAAFSAHRRLGCADCHIEPGLAGWLISQVRVGRWVAARLTDTRLTPTPVSNRACYRCHYQIERGPLVSRRVRISHKELAHISCLTCHQHLDHRSPVPDRGSIEALCARCHDGRLAPAGCRLCHSAGGKSRLRFKLDDYPKVQPNLEVP